jgi:hypothetical protein
MDERLVFGPAGCGASGREGFAWVGSCVGGFYLALGGYTRVIMCAGCNDGLALLGVWYLGRGGFSASSAHD